MFRTILLIFLIFIINYRIESLSIEYPSSKYIEERVREDYKSIDRIYQQYIIPREIQFHTNSINDNLPYFLRCKGSKKTINFTIPISANKHLSLDVNRRTNTITTKLLRNRLSVDLVGRYTCSEIVNDKNSQTDVYVFIQDERSTFTKRNYPIVYKDTGIHFFNLPCQTTSWYPRMSCEISSNRPQKDKCVPVYYAPFDLKAEKVFFDPQIGFALENPTIPNTLTYFTCMTNFTPSEQSRIPYDPTNPDDIRIHQPSLSVIKDETVRLSCEIQYGTKIAQRIPTLFWFEDIYDLTLLSNVTEKSVFNIKTQVYSRNSSITFRGFKPNKIYRFYCVRVSEQGLYSRSIDINCVDAPSLDVDIYQSDSDSDNKIAYGSNGVYDINIFTVPRSSLILELSRDGNLLTNDKRYQLSALTNQENQFHAYNLTINDITFEDERDLKLNVKSSALSKTLTIKPIVIGDPLGEFSFIPEQISSAVPWRNDNFKNKFNIYSYGISERESYRIVCTIRHRSDIKQPINVFIQHFQCSVENCLSDLVGKTCQYSSNQNLIPTKSDRINNYQTQLVSTNTYLIDNSNTAHQYLCCYQQNNIFTLAKAMTVLSRSRNMFNVVKPEFGLVTGDILKYRCEAHRSIYNNLQMIYNDGLFTYERNYNDNEWRTKGTNQHKQPKLKWKPSRNQNLPNIAIEIETPTLTMIGNNGYIQCIAQSKRSDAIPDGSDTYAINVNDPVPLQFKNNLQSVSRIDRKTSDDVEFDCKFNGRPKPKLLWFKGKLPLNNSDGILQFKDDNGSVSIIRLQASDTGYYTCELNNGRDSILRRSFDLRVKGTNPYSKFGRITAILVIISLLLLLLMIILLIIFSIKYFQMKRRVDLSLFHGQHPIGPVDERELARNQLTRIPLPDNFASTQQIRTFLSYVNGDNLPLSKDDFKELGRGQFGVVYQVRLPEVGLVAAKSLPDTIRNAKPRHDKHRKRNNSEEDQANLLKNENAKKKAAEMLIDEIKVMHKAGKHVNIITLKKVAYPETKFKFLFTGGPIRDEDSFYLMELCSNGSLESMLKYFLQSSINKSHDKSSLYQTLFHETERKLTVQEANEQCLLTNDDLKLIAYQVASGVDYLNRRQIAHCDIAARNVLVTSRFIMKICDFGLATWTTYTNYRKQFEQHESVQLEKKHTDIATHNLTPELARAFLRASDPDERSLLNKATIKSDVWSFGIFLWTLFLQCRVRPFNRLSEEMTNRSGGESFFHRLAQIISAGQVLRYIDYQPEIPQNIYAIIRECLAEENQRPEMTRICAYLSHSKMLSEEAFEFYRLEYNRYQEQNATDGNIDRFGGHRGVSDLPSFNDDKITNPHNNNSDKNVHFRPTTNNNDDQSDGYYDQQEQDSYIIPSNKNVNINIPQNRTQLKPSIRQPYIHDDSYL